jgi:hypothetical protein
MPRSLRKSIDAFCKWCIYDPVGEGRWRQQVDACPSADCPLYPVRPRYQPKRPRKGPIMATKDAETGAFEGPVGGEDSRN